MAGHDGGGDPGEEPVPPAGVGAVWFVHLAASLERPAPRPPASGEGDRVAPAGITPAQGRVGRFQGFPIDFIGIVFHPRGVTISAALHERLHVDLRLQASALCRRTPR
ncbi:hypothetical protein GCM10009527_058390 [Actinomadura nitritigenes]